MVIASLTAVTTLAGGCQQPLPIVSLGAPSNPAGPSPPAESVLAASNSQARQAADSASPAAPGSADSPRRQQVMVVSVTFDVLRTRVAGGVFSQSGKIWNHLDEEVIPAEIAAALNRNGLRIARGKVEAWPPIKALLDTQPHVQTSRSRLTVSNGFPLVLELNQQPRDQLPFMYRRDGTLVGARWPGSTNLLRIEYGVSATNPEALLVAIAPQIRLDAGAAAPSFLNADQWPTGPPEPPTLVLRELEARLQIGPDEFLAVGPAPATNQLPYIIGSLLLCEEDTAGRYESMYFITPKVSQTLVTPRGAQAGGPDGP